MWSLSVHSGDRSVLQFAPVWLFQSKVRKICLWSEPLPCGSLWYMDLTFFAFREHGHFSFSLATRCALKHLDKVMPNSYFQGRLGDTGCLRQSVSDWNNSRGFNLKWKLLRERMSSPFALCGFSERRGALEQTNEYGIGLTSELSVTSKWMLRGFNFVFWKIYYLEKETQCRRVYLLEIDYSWVIRIKL